MNEIEQKLINAHSDGLLLGEQRAQAKHDRQVAQLTAAWERERQQLLAAAAATPDRIKAITEAWEGGYHAAIETMQMELEFLGRRIEPASMPLFPAAAYRTTGSA